MCDSIKPVSVHFGLESGYSVSVLSSGWNGRDETQCYRIGHQIRNQDNGWWKIQSFRRYGVFSVLDIVDPVLSDLSPFTPDCIFGARAGAHTTICQCTDTGFLQTVLILIAVFAVVA